MFLQGDYVSEVIAHFIGCFHIEVEAARARLSYDGFEHASHRPFLEDIPAPARPVVNAPLDAESHSDSLRYTPPAFTAQTQIELHLHVHAATHYAARFHGETAYPQLHGHFSHHAPAHGYHPEPGVLPAPGSVAAVIVQERLLSDDDSIVTGHATAEALALASPASSAGLDALIAATNAVVDPAPADAPVTSVDQIPVFIAGVAASAHAQTAGPVGTVVTHAPDGTVVTTTKSIEASTQPAEETDSRQPDEAPSQPADATASQPAAEDPAPAASAEITKVHTVVTHSTADSASEPSPAPQHDTTIDTVTAPTISGTFVNGSQTDVAPSLDDSLPPQFKPADEAPTQATDEVATGAADDPAPDAAVDATQVQAAVTHATAELASTPSPADQHGLTSDTVTAAVAGTPSFDGHDAAAATDDALASQLQPVANEPAPVTQDSVDIDAQAVPVSIDVTTGGNLLVNEASLTNAGLTSTFVGVAGDFHRLDAIIQTNAYSDHDSVGGDFRAADATESTSTTNSASFDSMVRDSAGAMASDHPGALPTNWSVATVAGDMVFLNWMTQHSFTSDNDSLVLTATGTHTTISSGENLGLDHVAFSDIGSYYDLMLIGGNLYDSNIIQQTNILFDDDSLQSLTTLGNATASTGGNLLWNQAQIVNVGASDWQQGLPSSYASAMETLSGSSRDMPSSLQADQDFAGFGHLRVLYVAGSVYDLQYVSQTNVLGDADDVTIYQDQLASQDPDVSWSVSTGHNALINAASIFDYDSVGETAYHGGQLYSDALLVQADIVPGSNGSSLPDAGSLASELVAFLHDDTDAPAQHDEGPITLTHTDSHSFDSLHAMVA